MRDGTPRWQLVVPTGGDTLRQERLTRSLHDTLRREDALTVGFVDDSTPPAPGRKGAGAGELALWVASAGAVARPVSQVLITLIKEWCATERHRRVVVACGDRSATIDGRVDAAQERLARAALEDPADRQNSTDRQDSTDREEAGTEDPGA